QIPHAAQQSMSGESTPKLGGAVPAFETFMEEWKRLSNAVPHCAAYIKPGLVVADTYYKKMGKTKAYVITMFVDPTIRMTWVNEHWSSPNAMEANQVIKDLMTEYRASGTLAGTAQSVPADQVPHTFPKPKLASRYYRVAPVDTQHANNLGPQTVDQEFSAYVTASISPLGSDPLSFW
ncbi:hypothetical protein PISMIDRAFT_37942, partial [Pisolithus microcarpus 441]